MWNMTTEREEGSTGGDKQERLEEDMWNPTTEREEGSIGGDKQERLEEGICGTRLLKERKAPLEVTSKRDTQKTYVEHDY